MKSSRKETREDRKAMETLLTLGCVDGSKLPEWAWRRGTALALRTSETDFSVKADAQRFASAVREGYKLDRLPPGVGAKIIAWGKEWQARVRKRVRRDATTRVPNKEEARRTAEQSAAVRRRMEAALEAWALDERLFRAGGRTRYKVDVVVYDGTPAWACAFAKGAGPKGPRRYGDEIDPKTGQVNIDAEIEAHVRPTWYGRVARRGLTFVQGELLLDADRPGAEVDVGDAVLIKARVATRGVGFQIVIEHALVRVPKDGSPPTMKYGDYKPNDDLDEDEDEKDEDT